MVFELLLPNNEDLTRFYSTERKVHLRFNTGYELDLNNDDFPKGVQVKNIRCVRVRSGVQIDNHDGLGKHCLEEIKGYELIFTVCDNDTFVFQSEIQK